MSKEARARQAEHELQITQEAREKARGQYLRDAVEAARANDQTKAFHCLLKVVAQDDLEMMVRVPIQDAEYEREAEKRRAEQPN